MSMILLIRNADDMRRAIADTKRFSDYWQERFGSDQKENRILGVWLRCELDAGLPRFSCGDPESGEGHRVEDADRSLESNPATSTPSLRVGQSFSLSGIWTLCRVDGFLPGDAQGSVERRLAIVHTLVSPYSQDKRGFPPYSSKENRWITSKPPCASFERNIQSSSPQPGSETTVSGASSAPRRAS